MANLQNFEKYNPFRSPSWRFNRVFELIDGPPFRCRPSRLDDDRFTSGYYYFLLDNQCTDWKNTGDTLSDQDPALVQAHMLRWSPNAEDRAIVEARILAGETDAAIGKRLGLMPEAVDWYEDLFFCVRDRLGCSSWIRKIIRDMGGEMPHYGQDTLTERQRHTVYRLFGHYGGPYILDATLQAFPPRPGKAGDRPTWIDDALRIKIRQAAAMAIGRFNKSNIRLLFRLHRDLIKQARSARTSADSVADSVANNVANNARACMEAICAIPGLSAGDPGQAAPRSNRARGRGRRVQ